MIRKLLNYDYRGIFFTVIDRNRSNFNILFFNKIIHLICYCKGMKLGKGVIFNGNPRVRRHHNSTIYLGNECRFNSSLNSIIIGLYQPCSFVTFRDDSEIIFGNNCGASGLTIVAVTKIHIGNNVLIGANCTIVDTDFHHQDLQKRKQDIIPARPIKIEDNVFIGFHCFILKGVTIGKNSVIGANSVVITDIPENSVAIGNPCKVIFKKNNPNQTIG